MLVIRSGWNANSDTPTHRHVACWLIVHTRLCKPSAAAADSADAAAVGCQCNTVYTIQMRTLCNAHTQFTWGHADCTVEQVCTT